MKIAIENAYKKLVTTINEIRFSAIIDDSDAEIQYEELQIYDAIVDQVQDNPSIKDV